MVFRLDHRAYVTVLVRDGEGTAVRRAALGVQEARRHVWRWDGRSSAGRVLPDGRYRVILRAWGGESTSRQSTSTVAVTSPDAGRLVLSRPTVYPAATAVVDSLVASYVRAGFSEQQRLYGAYYGDRPIRLTARFVVVDADGAKVLERTSTKYRPDFSWTARNAADRPLEPGAYTLRVRITDEAGNARTMRRDVVVSDAQLTERLWTVTMPAASADHGARAGLRPVLPGLWRGVRSGAERPLPRRAQLPSAVQLRLRRRGVLRRRPARRPRSRRRLPCQRHRWPDHAG